MNDRSASGAPAPATQPQARIWAFTMEGYLPDSDAIVTANDAAPTPADLAADRLLARLDELRQHVATRFTSSALRSGRTAHDRTDR